MYGRRRRSELQRVLIVIFLANRRVLFDLEKNGISGFPDGMTIDAEDKLWVAVYGGAKVSGPAAEQSRAGHRAPRVLHLKTNPHGVHGEWP